MYKKITNENYFEKIDSNLKAYLLGFFIADGSIFLSTGCKNSYRFSINISEEDKYINEFYKREICPNNKIVISNYQCGAINRKPTAMIRWTSTKMKEDFEKLYNIKQNKTLDFNFEFNFNNLNEKYYFDFIRGFFDGDGHISYNEITHHFTLGFYGTSEKFLKQIGEIISKNCNTNYIIDVNKKRNVDLYCLRFNSNNNRYQFIKNLYSLFYNNSNYYLIRKKIKFENYLNTLLNKEINKSLSV